jgi:fused signal recognition particle receptor
MLKGFFGRISQVFSGRTLDEEFLEELEEQLIMSDVSITTTDKLIQGLRDAAKRGEAPTDDDAREVMKDLVATMLASGDRPLKFAQDGGITVWLFVGVNGVGKTTSVGKLAYAMKKRGFNPILAACDTFRAAAIEQLQEWGRRADCPVISAQQGADPAAVAFDAINAAKSRGHNIVLIDTAGRLHTKHNLMNELAKIARVTERELGKQPEETLLVLDATTGQNGLNQAQQFAGSAPLTGLILTKWDGTAKGGIILTVASETSLPVKLIGVGEKADDLIEFKPQKFADEMFGE